MTKYTTIGKAAIEYVEGKWMSAAVLAINTDDPRCVVARITPTNAAGDWELQSLAQFAICDDVESAKALFALMMKRNAHVWESVSHKIDWQ